MFPLMMLSCYVSCNRPFVSFIIFQQSQNRLNDIWINKSWLCCLYMSYDFSHCGRNAISCHGNNTRSGDCDTVSTITVAQMVCFHEILIRLSRNVLVIKYMLHFHLHASMWTCVFTIVLLSNFTSSLISKKTRAYLHANFSEIDRIWASIH